MPRHHKMLSYANNPGPWRTTQCCGKQPCAVALRARRRAAWLRLPTLYAASFSDPSSAMAISRRPGRGVPQMHPPTDALTFHVYNQN